MDEIKEAFLSLFNRKQRAMITIAAVSSGIFILLVTASVSSYFKDISKNINRNFENKIFFCEKKSFWTGGGLISEEKLPLIKSIPQVKTAIPMLIARLEPDALLTMGIPFIIAAVPAEQLNDYMDIRLIHRGTAPEKESEAIIGWDLAKNKNLDTGSQILVRKTSFTVCGILKKTSSILDRQMIVPLPSAQKALSRQHLLTCIIAIPQQTSDEKAIVAEAVKRIDWLEAVKSQDIRNELREVTAFWDVLTIVFFIISALASLLSIATVMLMSVTERKKEIAVRKAIGAENHHIYKEFLAESLLLTIAGWLLGTIFTLLFVQAVSSIPAIGNTNLFRMNAALIFGALIWTIVVGAAASFIPVRATSKIEPMETLRNG